MNDFAIAAQNRHRTRLRLPDPTACLGGQTGKPANRWPMAHDQLLSHVRQKLIAGLAMRPHVTSSGTAGPRRSGACAGGVMGLLAALAICWPTQVAGADLSLQILYGLKSNPKNPRAELVQGSDGNFYGTTAFGGTGGENGTVFAITPAGVFAILHSFQGLDGALPWSSLVQGRDGLFYGTAQGGGTNGDFGTVFQIATNGDFTVLHYFGGSDGRYPQAPLRQDADGNYYGTTAFGGTNGDQGTVFKITPKGLFTSLFSFSGTNGRRPVAGLIQARDGNFYGTTAEGGLTYEGPGVLGQGTVFRMTPEGALTPLFSFSGPDGSGPTAGLVETSAGSFYGTTQGGGANGDNGTVFKITPGAGLSTLYSFAGPD